MTETHTHHLAGPAIGTADLLSSAVGGFASFYTIWFFCILQFSPFFLAFMAAVGASMEGKTKEKLVGMATPVMLCAAGYILFFTLMGATASETGALIFRYSSLLGQFGGILGILLGAWFIGPLRTDSIPPRLITNGGGFLLGLALAINYQPCATPTLTLIYDLTKSPSTVVVGGLYLAAYALGVCIAIILPGIVIMGLLFRSAGNKEMRSTRLAAGWLLVAFGILVVANWMTIYKGYLVGGFV